MIEYKPKSGNEWEELHIHECRQIHDYDAACFHLRINGVEYLNGWSKPLQNALAEEKAWLVLQGKWFNQKDE